MGVQVRLAREPNPGGTGTLDYLNAGLSEEVKSAFWVCSNPTADDTSTTHAAIGLGCTNGAASADQESAGTWRRDNVTTLSQRGRNRNDTAIDIFGVLAGTVFTADLDSFINTGTRGARLNFTVTSSGTAACSLFAGSDLSVATGTITGSAVRGTPNTESTGLSNIDLILFFSAPNASVPGSTSNAGSEYGACAQRPDGTIDQRSVAQHSRVTTGVLAAFVSTDRAWTRISDVAVTNQLLIEAISGGDFDWSGGPAAATLGYFAFDFGGRAQATVRGFTNDTASSDVSVDTGFEPFWAFVVQTLLDAADTHDTSDDAGTLSYGMVDVADQYAFAQSMDDGDGVTVRDVCKSYMDQVAIAAPLPSTGAFGSGALKATADFGATSVDLSFSVNDAAAEHHGFLVAIGPTDLIEFVDDDLEIDDEAVGTGFIATDDETVEITDEAVAVLDEIPPPDSPADGREFRLGAGRGGAEALDAGRGGAEALG